jgi:hypothetical protein
MPPGVSFHATLTRARPVASGVAAMVVQGEHLGRYAFGGRQLICAYSGSVCHPAGARLRRISLARQNG